MNHGRFWLLIRGASPNPEHEYKALLDGYTEREAIAIAKRQAGEDGEVTVIRDSDNVIVATVLVEGDDNAV